jgi:sugar phosphate isomerase/epimerase
VVHSYAENSYSYSGLLEKAACNINIIAKALEREKLPINFAVELNRGAIDAAPGTTYDGLIELNNRINSEKIGFCWDFGHAYSNMLKNSIPLNPPHDFINKVIHTHIHGVDKNDTTHCPLDETNLPLVDYIKPLIKASYNGIYNLEINPEQLPEANAVDIYVENVNRIKKILKERKKSIKETGVGPSVH